MKKEYWLGEINNKGRLDLIDGPHSDAQGAEEALELRKRLPMIDIKGRVFKIVERTEVKKVEMKTFEPKGFDGKLNEDALDVISKSLG